MKENLFDHIIINGDVVEFGLCRKMTTLESLCSGKFGDAIKCEHTGYIYPTTFREFLKCLKKTKITKNLKFKIAEQLGKNFYETSFNSLLNHYVEYIRNNHAQTQKEIVNFYSTAHKIREEKIKEQQIMNSIPKEYIK